MLRQQRGGRRLLSRQYFRQFYPRFLATQSPTSPDNNPQNSSPSDGNQEINIQLPLGKDFKEPPGKEIKENCLESLEEVLQDISVQQQDAQQQPTFTATNKRSSKRKSFNPPTTSAPKFIYPSNQKQVNLMVKLLLIQGKYLHSPKNLVLAAPHPGGSELILQSVLAAASHIPASRLKIVDYQSFLEYAVSNTAQENSESAFILEGESINVSKAFQPGLYEIEDYDFDDNADVHEEDEDEEEPSQNFGASSNASLNSQKSTASIANTLRKLPTNIVLNLNLFTDAKKESSNNNNTEKTSQNIESKNLASLNLANITFGSATPLEQVKRGEKKKQSEKSRNVYNNHISDAAIKGYLTILKQNIQDRHLLQESQNTVLFIRDTTDLLEGTVKDCGKRILSGLLDMVSQLRLEGISVLLVASSTPALTDTRNIAKDIDFYSQIIDGNLPNLSSQESQDSSIAADGTLFKSSLDLMQDEFDKIELLPPSKIYGLLGSGKERSLNLKGHQEQSSLLKYLGAQERAMKLRIGEINCKFVHIKCLERGISLNFSLNSLIAEKNDLKGSRKTLKQNFSSPAELYAVELMTRKVWDNGMADKLIDLAVSSKLDAFPNLALERGDFEVALKIIYETDISRCQSLISDEKEITPAQDTFGGGGGNAKTASSSTLPNENQDESVKGTTNPKASFASSSARDEESVYKELKRKGVTLNKHEKRILSTVVDSEKITVEFADLILPPTTKLALQTLVTLPLLRPEFFQSGILSRSSINGVLLFGPPGTGKTMLAKAVAKSSGAWFMNVALSDIFEKYVGEGEKNVRAIFSLARKLSGPVVIFLDEVDAVFGTRRSDGTNSSRREIMNEFMSEWDGLISNNNGIVVLGATNRPFDLDDAILRRLPRRILVDLPTEEAREKIISSHMRGETIEPSVDLKDLALKTKNYSGSDLKNVCIAAALARMKECIIRVSESDDALSTSSRISEKLDKIDDWGSYLSGTESKSVPIIPINKNHIDIGMAECPPSLSDEMQTLIELRKWDNLYGDGAAKRKGPKSNGIGFDLQV